MKKILFIIFIGINGIKANPKKQKKSLPFLNAKVNFENAKQNKQKNQIKTLLAASKNNNIENPECLKKNKKK